MQTLWFSYNALVFILFINSLFFIPQIYNLYVTRSSRAVAVSTYLGLLVVYAVGTFQSIMLGYVLMAIAAFCNVLTIVTTIVMYYLIGRKTMSAEDLPLQDILDSIPCNIYWKDANGLYLGANKAALSSFGLQRHEVIGKSLHDFLPKELADKCLINDHDVMYNNKPLLEEEYDHVNERMFLSSKQALCDASGNVIGMIGASFDCTGIRSNHQQQAERLEAVLASLPAHFYWTDMHGKIQGCSHYMAQLHGVFQHDTLIGKSISELPSLINPDSIERSNALVMKNRSRMVVEEHGVADDGSTATFLAHKAPLIGAHNQIKGVLSLSMDISALKLERAQLKQAIQDADIANQVKYAFIANMSHDIRTPMSGIISMAEAMVARDQGEKEDGIALVQAGNRLLELLNEIIEISQIGSEKLIIKTKKFQLKQLVAQIIDLSIPAANNKQLSLRFTYDKNIPSTLICDPIRVHRIVLNLLSNAIKFTETGRIQVSAQLAQEAQHHCIIKLAVQDTGIGIPKDQHDFIFNKFNKLKESCTESGHQGLGLGLSIVKGFVEDLHGEVYVNSDEGAGAEFVVYLPMKKVLVENESHLNMQDIETVKNYSAKGSAPSDLITAQNDFTQVSAEDLTLLRSLAAKILVVDDDRLVQTATQLILQNFGCEVVVAQNGEEALQHIATDRFDLVLMDIGLPDISGFEVIERIRQQPGNANTHLPIIVFTAHIDLGTLSDVPSGITDIYNKPMTTHLCRSILTKYLVNKLETTVQPEESTV
jgi:two-component system aerobic respiration control sensor histidine kinase ArcB